MVQGDRNTSFYHVSTLIRRKHNKILNLKDSQGEWINDLTTVMEHVRNSFSKLFSTELLSSPLSSPSVDITSPQLSSSESHNISLPVSNEEIKNALWSLKAFKSLGPDGLHVGFFQRFWLVVGRSVSEEIKKIFSDRKIPLELNQTHISLIPKTKGPESIGNFRPISLCNSAYKIITKILVARIRPFLDKLISPYQATFVPGRKGVDSVIIAQELIHTISRKKGQKINFAKSKVFFSPNVNREQRADFCETLGFNSTPKLGSYLGFPLRHAGASNQDLNFILDRVNQKLVGWKANLLSFAGRKVLIQATTSAIPSYVMQTTFLPSRILDNLDRLNRYFLWGSSELKRRMHWVGWEKITQPLDKGGLGLQTAKGRN
ncbi:hypothetical protein SO802_028573 [Lithocarpus litseifolius]|uniref:Reverse transcriptase domain-containing protein n=1 Tax=Lithocarpus litseifolius TaxID=425828 RepID=A0AAW2BTT0_9ROSI